MPKTSTAKVTRATSPKTISKSTARSLNVNGTRTYLYETKTQNLSDQVFEDNFVTGQEFVDIKMNHEEIIRDFLCACDLLEKMEKNKKEYSKETIGAARYVVERLMRAREKSYAMINKASYYNYIPPIEKKRRIERKKHPKRLNINFNLYEIFALDGNAHKIVEYARRHERERLMNPMDIQKTEKRIMLLVNQVIKSGKSSKRIEQFIRDGLNERMR